MLPRRSTLIMALFAVLAGSMAGIHLNSKEPGTLFGSSPEPAGEFLYRNFELGDVEQLVIAKSKGAVSNTHLTLPTIYSV